MKIPKCQKSLSGKHDWHRMKWYHPGLRRTPGKWAVAKYPTCSYCGMIDDRKEEKRVDKLATVAQLKIIGSLSSKSYDTGTMTQQEATDLIRKLSDRRIKGR